MDKNVKITDTEANIVSYIAFESTCSRLERSNKRLFILCIVLIVALIASNLGWVIYESQYEDVTVTQEVDQENEGEGDNNFIGGDYYNTSEE